jgi:hypothetical protein
MMAQASSTPASLPWARRSPMVKTVCDFQNVVPKVAMAGEECTQTTRGSLTTGHISGTKFAYPVSFQADPTTMPTIPNAAGQPLPRMLPHMLHVSAHRSSR